MQQITPDFVYSQFRVALVAVIAYCGGAGYFSPAGVTLATALTLSLLPILVPWGFSAYASWGVVKVKTDSIAASVAAVENLTDNKEQLKKAVDLAPTPKP